MIQVYKQFSLNLSCHGKYHGTMTHMDNWADSQCSVIKIPTLFHKTLLDSTMVTLMHMLYYN